ncbi:ATP-binding protein [Bdellovibrionota bacterium FG-2]
MGKIGGWELDLIRQELTWTDKVYSIHEVDLHFKPTVDTAIGFYTPSCVPIITQALQRTIERGDPFDLELEIVTARGNSRMVRALGKRREFSAEAKTVFGVFQDITERKQAEGALREAKEFAEQANRTKDLFLATLSHELRTPLTEILSWSQLIKCGRLAPEKSQRGIEAIEQSARSQSRLINDLLDVSRIASGKLMLESREISPAQIIFSEIETHASAAAEKQIEIIHEVATDVTTVFADPLRLHQILWNLLGNALKFTPRGGKIWVSLRSGDHYAEFVIRDNGMGIAPEFLGHIFDRFSQAVSSSTRLYGGLGLGLAISSSLVRMMGGAIKAESPGKDAGATFTFHLPIRAPAIQPEASLHPIMRQITLEEVAQIKGTKILCVDDDPVTLEAIRTVLESYGVVVRSALSAKQALEILSGFTFDLIISDIAMPDIDGYGLFEQIRSMPSQKDRPTPVIALTAYAGPEDQKQANEAGFHGYLAKPVDTHVLLQMVANFVLKI